ncbi:MAG: NDP-sugar synthase [Acidobacteria bacterium]|nr:MAG: NDP-sugar synthase [Acidobacteriota bacterium]
MILAAGYGTRLWPLTADRAKPAVPFLNQPLISYTLAYLRAFGIRSMIINLHYHPETVRRAVRQHAPPDVDIHFSYEPRVLGTGGALDRVRDRLANGPFIVVNGKIITEIDLRAVLDTHLERRALATLVLKPNTARERFSRVDVDATGRILGFGGFPTVQGERDEPPDADPPLLFTGIQILDPRIFAYIPRDRFSHTTSEAYPRAIQRGELLVAHITNEPWYELSTLSRYLETHLRFLRARGQSMIGGRGTIIDPGADVADSVLWERVRVERGARLHRCIVGDDVVIPSGTQWDRVAIVRAERCPSPERGEIIGDNLIVPIEPVTDCSLLVDSL